MSIGTRRTNHSRNRGVAAVEFALVLPVLLIIVFGMIELSNLAWVRLAASNAARETARAAITADATSASARAVGESSLSVVQVNGATISVSPNPESAKPGTLITASVSVPYDQNKLVTGFPTVLVNTTVAVVVMRKE